MVLAIISLPVTPPRRSLPPRTGRGALLLAVLLAATGCFLFPIPPSKNAERPNVTSFDIQGTHAISSKELRQHLATQESGRKYLVWPAPEEFDQDAFANDKRRILRYYQARGYYRARVDAAEVLPDGPGRVRISVHVDEGEPVRVTQVEVQGLEQAPEARAKLRRLPIQSGDVFTEAAYDEARAAVLAALTSTGWAKAEVTEHAEVDPVLNQAHITYIVKPGERYRFGGVFVAGAAAIPRARIRAEAEPVVKPGTIFDATELPKAQARVFDLGVFGGVRVAEGPADKQKRSIPVVVSVREAPFRTLRAGPGFTFQFTRWEADATAGWSHRNWLGGLRKLNLDARAGYAWLPNLYSKIQKQGFVGLARADFTQPGMFARFVDLNLHGELEHGLEQAYDFNAERFRIGLPLRLGRLFTFVPSLNFELYQLSNAVTQPNAANTAQLTLATCPGHDPSVCLLSYFEQRIGIDLRDDPINTTRGFYFGISVQEGFSALGLGSSYLRILPEARAFVSLGGGFVLAGRGRLGFLEALPGSSDVPIVARFTSGGPNLMRGYSTRQLAPALLACPNQSQTVTTCTDALQYVPIGGNGLVDGSFELRFPLVGQLAGAVFLDFGAVRFVARDAFNVSSLQYAVGAGVRYKTVFGPLRVDVATRLPKADGNQPTVEVLTLDPNLKTSGTTHAYPYVTVHLSIGEAF
jgi:translocation and assembly module TamA